MNLGGAPSAVSRDELLSDVKVRRGERDEQQLRHERARRIQARWRSRQAARLVRREMRGAFDGDVAGLLGLRCLALIGRTDEDALAIWSDCMVAGGSGE